MGETPATKAKATASGIIASDTAKPLRAFFAADSGLNGLSALRGPSGVNNNSGAFATKSSAREVSAATAAASQRVSADAGRRSNPLGILRACPLVAMRPERMARIIYELNEWQCSVAACSNRTSEVWLAVSALTAVDRRSSKDVRERSYRHVWALTKAEFCMQSKPAKPVTYCRPTDFLFSFLHTTPPRAFSGDSNLLCAHRDARAVRGCQVVATRHRIVRFAVARIGHGPVSHRIARA